jgi:hypothetical protein
LSLLLQLALSLSDNVPAWERWSPSLPRSSLLGNWSQSSRRPTPLSRHSLRRLAFTLCTISLSRNGIPAPERLSPCRGSTVDMAAALLFALFKTSASFMTMQLPISITKPLPMLDGRLPNMKRIIGVDTLYLFFFRLGYRWFKASSVRQTRNLG